MSPPTALLAPPAPACADEQKDALPHAAPLLMLSQRIIELDLADRVERALRATGYGPLRDVQVTADAWRVALEGRVPSYYLKQVAQATALSVSGVREVRNNLQVVLPH
jgi:osmotically-inducible protein OsmY